MEGPSNTQDGSPSFSVTQSTSILMMERRNVLTRPTPHMTCMHPPPHTSILMMERRNVLTRPTPAAVMTEIIESDCQFVEVGDAAGGGYMHVI
jgi:hypothetical protein